VIANCRIPELLAWTVLPLKLHPEEASKATTQIKRKITFMTAISHVLNVITMGCSPHLKSITEKAATIIQTSSDSRTTGFHR
jgi:hypothetical protein